MLLYRNDIRCVNDNCRITEIYERSLIFSSMNMIGSMFTDSWTSLYIFAMCAPTTINDSIIKGETLKILSLIIIHSESRNAIGPIFLSYRSAIAIHLLISSIYRFQNECTHICAALHVTRPFNEKPHFLTLQIASSLARLLFWRSFRSPRVVHELPATEAL